MMDLVRMHAACLLCVCGAAAADAQHVDVGGAQAGTLSEEAWNDFITFNKWPPAPKGILPSAWARHAKMLNPDLDLEDDKGEERDAFKVLERMMRPPIRLNLPQGSHSGLDADKLRALEAQWWEEQRRAGEKQRAELIEEEDDDDDELWASKPRRRKDPKRKPKASRTGAQQKSTKGGHGEL